MSSAGAPKVAVAVLLGDTKEALGEAPAGLALALALEVIPASMGMQRERLAGALLAAEALSRAATLARTRKLSGERKMMSPRCASNTGEK